MEFQVATEAVHGSLNREEEKINQEHEMSLDALTEVVSKTTTTTTTKEEHVELTAEVSEEQVKLETKTEETTTTVTIQVTSNSEIVKLTSGSTKIPNEIGDLNEQQQVLMEHAKTEINTEMTKILK